MIPIFVAWTEYTATLQGRVYKLVPCENCATEYVYVLEREGVGCGTSLYMLTDDTAQKQAATGAEESLQSYLENDFDPVPCPVCGHYQRFMFPKLYDGGSSWTQLAHPVLLFVGCLGAVCAAYWGIAYAQQPGDRALTRLAVTLALLAILAMIGIGVRVVERSQASRFDPNTEDQQARIEKGRSRAVTRAEFDAARLREQGVGMFTPGAATDSV